MRIARRIEEISPSATMVMKLKADELKAAGQDVLSFAVGEPDFQTPDSIIEAAKRAMDEGQTKYTAPTGTVELRQAICDAAKRYLSLDYSPSQVLVSNGAKHTLMNLAMALVQPGDEVIVISPYWVTYPDQISVCGGRPVVVETRDEDDFQPDLEEVERAVTDYTVAIVLNSPCNPTGAVYAREVVEGLAEIAIAHDLVVISDEIYKDIIFDDNEHISPAALDGMQERTVIVDGVAKSYAMTGWRIGWMLGPEEIVAAAAKLQSQSTSCPNTIAQAATIQALTGPQESVGEMREQFERRRDFVVERLSEVPGVTCSTPHGTFYAFPNISEHSRRLFPQVEEKRSEQMALWLLERSLISLVPG